MDLVLAFTTLAVVAASLLFDWWYFSWLRSTRLPPGPTPWPIVGSLPQLMRLGPGFLTMSKKLAGKYGKILTLWIGNRPVIVVNDPALTYDALVKQGTYFANRCKLSSQRDISCGFLTLNTSEGALTAALRKNVMTHMLGPAKLKAYKRLRDSAYEDTIRVVKEAAAAAKDGEAEVDVSAITRFRLLKITLVLVFGVELGDDLVQELMHALVERFGLGFAPYLGDYIYGYRLFERKDRQNLKASQRKCEELFGPIIDKVRPLQDDNSVIGGNYCETLFQLEKEFPAMNNSLITSLCCEFINASYLTTAGAVNSAMALLSKHPQVQKKLYQGIEHTVGSRIVDERDLPELPYLSAVVRETLRSAPPGKTTLPHATSELRKLGGYDIPTDAIIFFGLESLHHDPGSWPDPLDFKPERFLEDDLDVYGTRDFRFLPFSAGRRVCPGIQLAMLELPTIVARMVQTFEWRELSSVKNVDTGGMPGTVLYARHRESAASVKIL